MFGRICFTVSALFAGVAPFIADFNETHVLNPRWPPHAKFHNGQTMSMGLGLGIATLYYAYRAPPVPANRGEKGPALAAARDSILTAAIFGSLYWVTALSAILYPGSLAIDPEFGEGFPQFWVFVGALAITWVGWWAETRRLGMSR